MSADESAALDEQCASWLAAWHAARAGGVEPLSLDDLGVPAELRARLERDLACLQLLDKGIPLSTPEREQPARREPEPGAGTAPVLIGRFQVRGELGRGGYGIVFHAHDPQLNRAVALKVPRAEILVTPDLRERFLREAQTAAGLDHPNIVPVYEAGAAGPVCYIASAYCPGLTLAQWLRARPEPVPWHLAAALVARLAAAVEHAHRRGVIHRDLKPGNILLEPAEDGEAADADRDGGLFDFVPRITDFGLAKVQTADAVDQTASGAILGTPSYMAPEQAEGRSHQVGPTADVYGLGVLFYEMLTGRLPFLADNVLDLLQQVKTTEPVPPSRLRPRLPADLETVCLKCLQKEPRKRYARAEELAEDLQRFLRGEPVLARPVGRLERFGRWCRRNPALAATSLVAAGAILAGLAVTVAFVIAQGSALAALRQKQGEVETANADLTEANTRLSTTNDTLLRTEEKRRRFTRLAAVQALDQGLALCEQGEVPKGLLWLARGLEIVPPGEADLEWTLRTSLAHWRRELISVAGVFLHTGEVRAVACSRDGTVLLTAGADKAVRLWDVSTGRLRGPVLTHDREVWAAAFGPDGKTVLSAGLSLTPWVWDLAAGSSRGINLDHQGAITSVAFHPDGQLLLTGSHDGTARLWDLAAGKVLHILRHPDQLYAVAFSPDGGMVLTGGHDPKGRLWDTRTGKLLHVLPHEGIVYAVAFGSRGKTVLTAGVSQQVWWWNATSGQKIKGFPHPTWVYAAAFSPDGTTVLTGDIVGNLRLWDVGTGKMRGRPLSHPGFVRAVAFGPDGRTFLSGGADGTGRLWQLPSGSPAGPTFPHDHGFIAVAFSRDGRRVLTGSFDKTARLWDAEGNRLAAPLSHPGIVRAVAFSPDGGTFATACDDGVVRRWRRDACQPLGNPLSHGTGVEAVAFSPDGQTLVTAGGPTVRLWNAATGSAGPHLRVGSTVRTALFSPDGHRILTGGVDRTVRLWSEAGQPLPLRLAHPATVTSAAWSPDGKFILTGCEDNRARVWDAVGGRLLEPILVHPGMVLDVAFSPDGRSFVTKAADNQLRLWSTATRKPLAPAWRSDSIHGVAFRPDGRAVLASGSDARIGSVWHLAAPQVGDPDRIVLWAETSAGLELDENSSFRSLDPSTWQDRKRRLEERGGPPGP
jgi:WD40 repeat protein